jgi:hypothetical protein
MTPETRLDDVFKQLNGGRENKAVLINLSTVYERVRLTFGQVSLRTFAPSGQPAIKPGNSL